jgi:hypothetical protein
MRPQWFKLDAIPYEMMWADDKDWLPLVLGGKKIEADFYFGDNNQVIKRKIKSLKLA